MKLIGLDCECYWDYWFVAFKDFETGQRLKYEMSTRTLEEYPADKIRALLLKYNTVGFNSLSYDLPLIWLSLREGMTTDILKRASDRIIKGGLKWWEVEDALEISIPKRVKEQHIDLIEPQPNPFTSLKILNGRLHGRKLQDLPVDPEKVPTFDEMEILSDYCYNNDLDATHLIADQLEDALELRRFISEDIGTNVMSKSDAQIGEAIIKHRAEKILGKRVYKPKTVGGQSFRYQAPDFIKFQNPQLQSILKRIQEHDFVVRSDGKVELPTWLKDEQVTIGSTTYQMGIGGLHSTESNRSVRSDNQYQLIDADVGSYYPSIILKTGLYPKSIGPVFLEIYHQIKIERMAAKRRGKEIKLLLKDDPNNKALIAEQKREKVKEQGLKIALNGIFGKLGSRYSIVFAPDLLISVTLTGQLALLMMIDRAESNDIPIVSANTDGIVFQCPREFYDGVNGDRLRPSFLAELTDQWEQDTGFDLEFVPYKALYNQSVNSYFAIKEDGGHKRKGPYTNPWSDDPNDKDLRGQMMGNPQMTICSDAALAQIKHGVPVRKTIEECKDIRQFVTVIKASKGATWASAIGKRIVDDWNTHWHENNWVRGSGPHSDFAGQYSETRPEPVEQPVTGDRTYLGKVVRYYWGIGGAPIYEAIPNEKTGNYKKIPKTDGAIECMELPDEFPDDIDYERYVQEAEKILREFGFYGKPLEPIRRIRLTKANKNHLLSEWAVQI